MRSLMNTIVHPHLAHIRQCLWKSIHQLFSCLADFENRHSKSPHSFSFFHPEWGNYYGCNYSPSEAIVFAICKMFHQVFSKCLTNKYHMLSASKSITYLSRPIRLASIKYPFPSRLHYLKKILALLYGTTTILAAIANTQLIDSAVNINR